MNEAQVKMFIALGCGEEMEWMFLFGSTKVGPGSADLSLVGSQ